MNKTTCRLHAQVVKVGIFGQASALAPASFFSAVPASGAAEFLYISLPVFEVPDQSH
jgi:hypothetical protein